MLLMELVARGDLLNQQLTLKPTLPSSTVDTILLFLMDLVLMEATMVPMLLTSLVARGDLLSLLLIPKLIPTMLTMVMEAMEATWEATLGLVLTMEAMPLTTMASN